MHCAFSISGISRIKEGCKVGTLSQPNSPRGARQSPCTGGALMKDMKLSLRRNCLQLLSGDLLEDELAFVVLVPNRAGLQASNPRTHQRVFIPALFPSAPHLTTSIFSTLLLAGNPFRESAPPGERQLGLVCLYCNVSRTDPGNPYGFSTTRWEVGPTHRMGESFENLHPFVTILWRI